MLVLWLVACSLGLQAVEGDVVEGGTSNTEDYPPIEEDLSGHVYIVQQDDFRITEPPDLIDYQNQQRVKLWGEAVVVTDDSELLAQVMPANYEATAAQVIVFRVVAWDANCPKHIPRRFEAEEVRTLVAAKDARIAELEAELRSIR
ncbi:MAG TPA: hypothetical protein PKY30_18540, partial [Myxococcota bacterium]|nr:hypothetical protein [Myxococcota bacterium]